MSVQFSVAVRNAMLDQIESTVGTSAKLEIRSSTVPASTAAANTGSVLVSYTLASDWAAAASSGSKSFNNTPISTTATGAGTAAHFRIYSSTNTCHWQGTVTATGGGGDMTVDNTNIASGQTVNITSFTITAGNA
jgi:hypothetical protein